MSWFRRRLLAAAEFADRDLAEAAWAALADADIAAVVEADPGPFGAAPLTRLMVQKPDLEPAQRVVAAFLAGRPDQ